MENVSPAQVWMVVAGILGAIVLVGNAADKIAKAVAIFKAPNEAQDAEIAALKKEVAEIKRKLAHDNERLDRGDAATRVSQEGLIALLEHGINGNNVKQMEQAKERLQNFLINNK